MNQRNYEFLRSLRPGVPTNLIQAIRPAIVACCLATQAQATTIPVPNGSFETLYKPGSTTITADVPAGSWTQGAGPSAALEGGAALATFSDTTTGSAVDIPGWVNAPATGTAPNGGWAPPYGWPKGSGTVSRGTTSYGSYLYSGNPSAWTNPYGAAIESAAPLTTVGSGRTYTLSVSSNNVVSPGVLDLLADGVILTPTTSGTTPDGTWTLHTNTYSAASLAGVVGQSLKIRVGWALGANGGGQGQLDNIQLADDIPAETVPPTLVSIEDNQTGGPITENDPVIYTVTFNEAMKASTVNTVDFGNASATATTVNSVSATANPAVFLVTATPTAPGTLQLEIKAGATLTDIENNALDTTAALADDTVITVNLGTHPLNENFADAIDLTGIGTDQTGDGLIGTQTGTNNVNANLEDGEPSPGVGVTNTVWFKWTCPADGNLTVNTKGSTSPAAAEWDAILGIYSGSALNALTPLGATPQDTGLEEAMTVAVTAGTTYSIQLAGYVNAVAANIFLKWTLVPTNGAVITAFGSGATIGTVVFNTATIAWTVPFGSDLALLAPPFTLSPGATCDQPNGGIPSPNFSAGSVDFTVTSSDAAIINVYTVTATVSPPSTACDITAFGPGATIDQGSQTITLNVPFGTSLASIAPTYSLSAGATCVPASGVSPSPNFSVTNPATYTVTAQDTNVSKVYTVMVVVGAPSTACDITTFGTNVAGSYAVITTTSSTTGTIAWTVPSGTTVATLAPSYTLSADATCPQPNPGIPTPALSIGSPVSYLVTAQDGVSIKDYAVTVTVVPTESALIWNLAGGGDWNHTTPNWLGQTSATVMPFFNSLNAVFNKIEGGTIAIAPDMLPASTTVSATSGTYTFSGSPIATGSLTKSGNGNLTITTANTYPGGTIINAGQLKMDVLASAALGSGPVTLNGGRLFLERVAVANALIVNGGNLYPDNGYGDSWTGPVTLNSDLIIQGPGYTLMTFNGSISGVGGLTLNGQGPVALQVANSYTGVTSVTDCTLNCNHVDALGSGALIISSGAKVKLNYAGEHNIATLTLGGVPQASGTHGSVLSGADYQSDVFFDASGTGLVRVPPSSAADMLTFSFGALGAATIGDTTISLEVPEGTNRSALAPTYTVSLGATCLPASGTTFDFTMAQIYTVTAEDGTEKAYTVTVTEAILPDLFTWANSGGGNWNDSANWTNEIVPAIVTAPLSGGRDVYTLNFNVAGTYTTTNNLSAGFKLNQLNFGATVTLAGNSLAFVANGATLPAINQNSANLVVIPNPLDLGANTTFGGTGNGQVNLTGLISGAGSLTKNGTGTLRIYNVSNSFAGGTIINNGTLFMDINAKLGTGPITLNGGILYMWRFKPTNALTVNGGSITSENGFNENLLAGPITLNATLVNNGFFKLTCSDTISGAGGLTKAQTGLMVLSNTCTSTYTGPTSVTAGTLQIDRAAAVSGSSALSISTGGAKVHLNYVGTKTIPALTLGGVAQTVPGTYGAVASGANFQNDTYFTAGGTGTVTILPSATISVFGTNVIGSSAVIGPVVANAAAIAWTVPFGTVLANLAPTFTVSYGATCTQTSGAIPSPSFSGGPVVYSVTSSDSLITNAYTVTITVAPPSSAKTLSNVYFPGHGYAWASDGTGFNLLMVVPNATNVTALAPTFSVPLFATCNVPSGTARNFTTPQTYTVTAQDGSTQAYTVAVQKITTPGVGSYQQKVLASGPVAYWPLNETSGTTAFDRAAGLNHITYGGTLTLNQTGLRADGNPSVRFTTAAADPANTRVAMNPSLNPREFTVECWIKPADATVNYFVSSQDRTTGGRTGFALWRNNGSTKYAMQCGTGPTTTVAISSTTDAVVGTVAHVVGTYDGTTFKLYVNGALEASAAGAYVPAGVGQPGFTIGSRNGTIVAANNIQDVALYSRALTLAEIQGHFQPTVSYATWASTYAGGQPANQDSNKDGVQNGIAYFMGATGIATNPGLNASNTITWPVSATFSGTYEVQTSPDLSTWTNVAPKPLPAGGNLSYTLPTGAGSLFVRLLVTPTP